MVNITDVEAPVPESTLLLITPVFVGSLASFLLYGVSIVQLYIYYVSYRGDSWYIRLTVYGVFVADTIQSIVVAGHGYGTLCAQWGRPKAAAFVYWYIGPLPIIASTLALWCQSFYAWRIYQLGGWKVVCAAIMILSLAQVGGAYGIGVVAPRLTEIHDLHLPSMFARTIVWLGGGSLADIIIMISMVYLLYSTRSSAFIVRRSELLINRLIRLSIETGCLCALTATVELITFMALPETGIHFIFSFILGKIYSNTLMVSLNSRRGAVPWRSTDSKLAPEQNPVSAYSLPQFRVSGQQTHVSVDCNVAPTTINASSETERDVEGFGRGSLDKDRGGHYELKVVRD